MDFEELDLIDRVALYVLPALLSSPDARKSLSNKTIVHEARQIAETFVASATLSRGGDDMADSCGPPLRHNRQ
ncbi:MAG: hypothetical protein LBF61_05090 [Azoarcus sp.]|jgi:hypothetical protein|nr:hypothetical protein [Azoarcus sp.]